MSSKQLLKLVFFHDQRMEELTSSSSTPSKVDNDVLSLFTKPDPTYSRLFFMGSDLANNRYGINLLDAYPSVVNIFENLYTLPSTLQWSDGQGIHSWIEDAPMDAYLRLVPKAVDSPQTKGVEATSPSNTSDLDRSEGNHEKA